MYLIGHEMLAKMPLISQVCDLQLKAKVNVR